MDNTNTAAWLILGICLVIIIVLGIFGNTLSFIIWTKGNRCSSRRGSIYLRLLALSDILVLCIPALELTVALLKPAFILRNLNLVFCKIFPVSPFFCVQLSTWIVICLTAEQTIAVCRPFQSMTSSSKWRHYGIVFIVTVVSFLDNIPHLLASNWDIQKNSLSKENVSDVANASLNSETFNISLENCTQSFASTKAEKISQNDSYQEASYTCVNTFSSPWHVYIVQLGMISVIPLLILTTCNIIILTKLLRQDKKLTTGDSRKEGQYQNSLVSVMTARTVAISIVQCVTTIPLMSWNIFFLFNTADSSTLVEFYICNTVYYLNNAVNVIFYCLLGQSFRQDCVTLFARKSTYGFKPSRRQTDTETGSTSKI